MNKFFLVDKPHEISSFDIIRKLRKKLNIKKMWHTWTLDPLATGLVLVAVWGYTKLIPYLEKSDKVYEYTLNLSGTTESLDLWEEIKLFPESDLKNLEKTLTLEIIKDLVKTEFTWNLKQIPPKYSALKIDWKRAYELAREWAYVKMKEREITVFSHEVLDFSFPEITLKAKVSAGSYIRTLAYDIGSRLLSWAYVTSLRRIWIDNLQVSDSQKLDELDSEKPLDFYKLFPKDKIINLTDSEILDIKWWKFLDKKDFMKPGEFYFVEKNSEIISVIEVKEDYIKAKVNI